MKSKFNPFLFRSLATGAALFAIAPLHAADVDTTLGVTLDYNEPGNKYIGAGTLTVSGGGAVYLGTSDVAPITEFAMTGGLIDIVSGTNLVNGGWQKGVWTDNLASLQVNGTLDIYDGNDIFADALTGSGTVTMGDISYAPINRSITVGMNGGGGTFTGTISDSADDTVSLIKTGGGTQILTGSNTYRGATTINGGTLKLQGAAFSTTARAYSIASVAVLNLDGNTDVASGNTTISGTGTLRISGGALGSSADGRDLTLALASGALIEIQSGASMVNGGYANLIWTGNLADMQVDGMFDLNDGNAVIIDALTGSGTVTTTNYTEDFSNSRTLTVGQDGGSGTFSGTITQATVHVTGLTKTGGGTQTLTGTNNYTGNTTINGGTLKLQDAAFSTTARAYSIASGAVLNLDGNTGVASGNTTISGTGTLRISGGGLVSGADGRDLTLELGSGALIDIQSGASMYNGGWQNMTWTNNKAGLQVNGTLEMGDGQWILADALTGSGTVTMDVGWATWENSLTVGVNGGGGTFDGTISDSGDDTLRLTKTGSGTQILTGTNTYRGNTTVNGGTLSLGNGTTNTALADTADVTVDSGCTLNLNYTGTDTIDELWLGGVQKSPGTYDSSNSGGLITGTGSLVVLNGPPADPYLAWINATWPSLSDKTPTGDPDNDGIANLMEYVLQGGDPSVSTTGTLPILNASGANFVFTYYRRAAATGTTQTFEYSTTLGAGSWTPVAIPGGAGVSVTDQGAGIDKVEITVAKGAETKLFGRLQVVK